MKGSLVCDGSTDCPHPDDDSDEDCRKLHHNYHETLTAHTYLHIENSLIGLTL